MVFRSGFLSCCSRWNRHQNPFFKTLNHWFHSILFVFFPLTSTQTVKIYRIIKLISDIVASNISIFLCQFAVIRAHFPFFSLSHKYMRLNRAKHIFHSAQRDVNVSTPRNGFRIGSICDTLNETAKQND